MGDETTQTQQPGNSDGILQAARTEAINERKARAEIQKQLAEAQGKLDASEKEIARLTRAHEKALGELTGYKGDAAWREALGKAMEPLKGKVMVDVDRAMKYLKRGAYNEETLAQDVKDAIDAVGVPVQAPAMGITLPGNPPAQDQGAATGAQKGDMLGTAVLRAVGA